MSLSSSAVSSSMLSGLRDLVDNPTPRVPVHLCLDTSGSMMGDPTHELNLGVQQYMTEMKSDDLTRCSAETAVVPFDDSADCVADFDTADRLQVPEMEAGGMTCMGEGLSLGLDLLEKRKAQYKATGVDYYQPILVVMSDGHPNGGGRKQRSASVNSAQHANCLWWRLGSEAMPIWRCWRRSVRDSGLSV